MLIVLGEGHLTDGTSVVGTQKVKDFLLRVFVLGKFYPYSKPEVFGTSESSAAGRAFVLKFPAASAVRKRVCCRKVF